MRKISKKKIEKRYTLIKVETSTVDNEQCVNLSYGDIDGYYDCRDYPTEIFDNEEDAMEYMLNKNLYGNWMLVPVYSVEYEYE